MNCFKNNKKNGIDYFLKQQVKDIYYVRFDKLEGGFYV